MMTNFSLKYEINASSCLTQMPVVPMALEYPEDEEEEGEGQASGGPTPSTSTKTEGSKKTDLKRGQHGRHQMRKKVHTIFRVGPKGEPLEPTTVIGAFSNQCSCIVREHVPITYQDWRKVPKLLKKKVWDDVKERFSYPEGYDVETCKAHALSIAGKALRTLRWQLKNYVEKGKTPFEDYNFIKRHVWEEFVT